MVLKSILGGSERLASILSSESLIICYENEIVLGGVVLCIDFGIKSRFYV